MKHYLFIYGEINGGGAERVLLDVLRNFDYANNTVDLLQINGGGVLADELPGEVNVLAAWQGYPLSFKLALRVSLWWGFQGGLRKRLLQTVGDRRYDVAISFLEGMPLKCHAMITEVAKRNYTWVHCDLYNFHYTAGLFRGKEEAEAYRKMDSVVCVSKDTADAFETQFPSSKGRSMVIYNPIDKLKILQKADEVHLENTTFTIVVCGRLTPQKKIDRVLRLAKRIKKQGLDIKIQLVGDGELGASLRDEAKTLRVEDVVEFVGFVRNPFPYVKAAQMLLSTSCAEGFSLVICEAMTLGIPVVSTKTAGPMEILGESEYGLLCGHDDESIYDAVCKMYEDPNLRNHYSQLGRDRVDMFSIDNTMEEIYKL